MGQAKLARSLSPTASPQLSTQVRKCVASPGRPSTVGPRIPGPFSFLASPSLCFCGARLHAMGAWGRSECGALVQKERRREERGGGWIRKRLGLLRLLRILSTVGTNGAVADAVCGCRCGCGCQKSGVASRPGSVEGGAARNPCFGRSGSFLTGSGAGSIQRLRYITPRRRDSLMLRPAPSSSSLGGGRRAGRGRGSAEWRSGHQLTARPTFVSSGLDEKTNHFFYSDARLSLHLALPNALHALYDGPFPQRLKTPNMLTAPMLPLTVVVATFFVCV